MRGGLIGGVCFLAFLLSSGIKGQNLLNSYDLQQDGQSGSTEYRSADAQYEDEEQPRVSSRDVTADATVEAEESSPVLGQYKTSSFESEENTDTSSDSLESISEDPLTLRNLEAPSAVHSDLAVPSVLDPEGEDRIGLSIADAFSGATSRVISQSDYIIPQLMLGGENLIVCSRENELHNVWSPVYQCLVCVCVRDGWTLQAICVSCNLCLNAQKPNRPILKEPILTPLPPLLPPLTPPLPPLLPPLPPLQPPLPSLPPLQPLSPVTPLLPPLTPQFPPLPPLQPPLPTLPPLQTPLPTLPPLQPPLPPLPPPLPPLPPPLPPLSPPLPPLIPPLPPLPPPLPPLPPPLLPLTPPLPPLPPPLPPLPPPLLPLTPPLPPLPPPLPPLPPPQPMPIPPVPPPQPDSQVSCAPLPTDTLFQNPLNPCQMCVCTRIYNVYGQPEVKIKCQENPQCVPDPDIIPIPPIPVPPQPVPMPLCEIFPLNVPFPHPSERCKICKCVAGVGYYTQEPMIICIRKPDCDRFIDPIPMIPDGPVPNIDIHTDSQPITQPEPEPMPWPPMLRPSTPSSPLPGPPPHETCKPYPPNTPFQHPWDECQICMCSEIYGRNVVNIEVNCYTKKSCCIEPPIPEPKVRPLSLPMYQNNSQSTSQATNDIIFIEPRCRYQQPQLPFVVDCNICTCQVIYSYVVAQCSPLPNCGAYPYSLIGDNTDASAQAIASAYSQDYSLDNPGLYGISDSQSLVPTGSPDFYSWNNLNAGSLSSQLAQSEATATSQSGNSYPYPNYYLFSPELSQSSAIAQANAESLSSQPSYLTSGYSITGNSLSNAQAQAEAIANAQFDNTDQYTQYPYSLADSSLSGAQAEADAYANAQYPGLNMPYDTYSNPLRGSSLSQYGSYPYSLNQAQASASAETGVPLYGPNQDYFGGDVLTSQQLQDNAQVNTPYGTYYGYPSTLGSGNYYDASASAQAEAIANSQSGGLSQYNTNPYYLEGSQSDPTAQAQAVANAVSGNSYISGSYGYPYSTNQVNDQLNVNAITPSGLYPSLYQQPNDDNTLYLSGTSWGDSSAQAQSSSATAQSLAQTAAISGRPLIRSGNEDTEDNSSNSSEE